jgi:adenylate cyclase
MSVEATPGAIRYAEPPPTGLPPAWVVSAAGTNAERRFVFYDRLEIGREHGEALPGPGVLQVADQTISRTHCVLGRRADGRWFLRDTSRNGTRLDGRRLVPNVEVEVHGGQRLSLADHVEFVVVLAQAPADERGQTSGTLAAPSSVIATVLVGDIQDYTVLVRRAPSVQVQQSVRTVFERLSAAVVAHGGTVKEYQGDAIVAFWEGTFLGSGAVGACGAALELDRLARMLAADPTVWRVDDFPLALDWALASGPVLLDNFAAAGLSMIGEPLVLAFRLEKFASPLTGRILACRTTRDMACAEFAFHSLGLMTAKGFEAADEVFALEHEKVAGAPHSRRRFWT